MIPGCFSDDLTSISYAFGYTLLPPSLPGGNQIDGLPPAASDREAIVRSLPSIITKGNDQEVVVRSLLST